MTEPLVTCLCLTRNRPQFLRQAIACFELQTYANRELLIVADQDSDLDGVDIADDRILLEFAPGRLTVGAKRNWGCERASGAVIAHWDDDDRSAPERVAAQVARLQAMGQAVTGYHSMKFTDGVSWWRYEGPPNTALGTSLLYYHSWWRDHPFAERQVGQDEAFAAEAASCGQLIVAGDLGQMYATIHPGNTAPRDLSADCYTPCSPFAFAHEAGNA